MNFHPSLPPKPPTPISPTPASLQHLRSLNSRRIAALIQADRDMRPSESNPNLARLGDFSIQKREGVSTPKNRAQSAAPTARERLMTPPQLLPRDLLRCLDSIEDDDDDVFGGANIQPRPRIISAPDPIPPPTNAYQVPQMVHRTRDSRQYPVQVTSENAQSFLNPHHLVFVANLPTDQSDRWLEQQCHENFKKYGKGVCFVKIKRDKWNHPYGYIQYCSEEETVAAIEGGKNVIIDGRKLRTERAQARRSVILTRREGGAISIPEAYEVLGYYGSIENIVPTTHFDKNQYGIGEGMRVTFAIFGDFERAKHEFNKENPAYHIVEAPRTDPRTKPIIPFVPYTPETQNLRSRTDQKSIFVGNLPEGIENTELLTIFGKFGAIVTCNIIRKPIAGGYGKNVFAFIEFQTIAQAEQAAAHTDIDIRGERVRIEPKEYSARRHTRLQFNNQPYAQDRSPRDRGWTSSSGNSSSHPPAPPGGSMYLAWAANPWGPLTPIQPIGIYGYGMRPPVSGYNRSDRSGRVAHTSTYYRDNQYPAAGQYLGPRNKQNIPTSTPTAVPGSEQTGSRPRHHPRHHSKNWRS